MQRAIRQAFGLSVLTILFTVLLAAVSVTAATFTVTNTNDGGPGSLRQAILDANATPDADIVQFDAGVFSTPQTITLTSGQLTIRDSNLTINGPGAELLSLSANNKSRSFLIRAENAPAVTVTINNLTIKDGNAGGGGIRVNDTGTDQRVILNISGVVIRDNTTNSGAAGGGIQFAHGLGELYVNNSIFRRNTANGGAAISCGGGGGACVAVTITNTLFEENVAGGLGGAGFTCCGNGNPEAPIVLENVSFVRNLGGNNGMVMRISHPTTQFIFRNMTVAGNNSGVSGNTAALQLEFGHFSFENSTIAYNTNKDTTGSLPVGINSIWGDTVISFRNTIVAKNSNAIGQDRDLSAQNRNLGRLDSLGYNIFGTLLGNTVIEGTTTGNQIGNDPLLDRVPRENGSFLKTLALRPGSPAIDAGDPATFLATDQRGITRPVDGDGNGTALPDIGAFEKRPQDVVLQTPLFDFEGDGRSDVSIFRPGPGQWWYLRSSDGGNRAFAFGQSTDEAVPGDFTGDGKTDIAFFRPSVGQWFVLRSEDSTFFAFPFGASGDVPVPGDFDGDGRVDAGIFRPSNSTWYVLRSSDLGITISPFGTAGDKPILGDFDGDGNSDLAVFRPAGGSGGAEWWFTRSSDGQNRAFAFGTSTDKAVAGDYTGDGKTDVAFWRPSSGTWYVLRSEDNSFYSFPFGVSTDVPVPADYDGDGRLDAAVFRPSISTWYLQRSTAGFEVVPFGTTGDRPLPATTSLQ